MKIENRSQYYESLAGECSIAYKKTKKPALATYHFHSVYEITLVLTDSVIITVEDTRYDIRPNTVLLFSNADIHKTESKNQNDFERYVLTFAPEYLEPLSDVQTDIFALFYYRPAEGMQILPLTESDAAAVRHIMEEMLSATQASPFFGQKLRVKLMAGELLVFLNNVYLKTHGIDIDNLEKFEGCAIFETIKYIDNNLDSDLKVETLAKIAYMNSHKFSQSFLKITGLTPNKYVIKRRLQKAKVLLQRGYRVEQVCDITGFHSLSNFSRTFKNNVGISPKQYAQKYKSTF